MEAVAAVTGKGTVLLIQVVNGMSSGGGGAGGHHSYRREAHYSSGGNSGAYGTYGRNGKATYISQEPIYVVKR